ncbi:MAG: hypothetical protein HY974_04855 [Candidatus Kerfeldbacteria bacterium]|nr:hypothetical protein [Candidatus Kerfeldbacteria bacterium]
MFQYPTKIYLGALLHALGVVAYTAFVAWILSNGKVWFGPVQGFIGPTAMLLLLVLSATITGLLLFGRPVYLYFNNAKTEAVKLLLSTVGWLGVITLLIFLAMASL